MFQRLGHSKVYQPILTMYIVPIFNLILIGVDLATAPNGELNDDPNAIFT